jgi:hypothetical protein
MCHEQSDGKQFWFVFRRSWDSFQDVRLMFFVVLIISPGKNTGVVVVLELLSSQYTHYWILKINFPSPSDPVGLLHSLYTFVTTNFQTS